MGQAQVTDSGSLAWGEVNAADGSVRLWRARGGGGGGGFTSEDSKSTPSAWGRDGGSGGGAVNASLPMGIWGGNKVGQYQISQGFPGGTFAPSNSRGVAGGGGGWSGTPVKFETFFEIGSGPGKAATDIKMLKDTVDKVISGIPAGFAGGGTGSVNWTASAPATPTATHGGGSFAGKGDGNGAANTGGGGAGGNRAYNSTNYGGGNGGSGIVIVRFKYDE